MTARTYDVILSVSNASAFRAGNNIIGNTTVTTGMIAAVDTANNKIKVKLSNLQQEFSATEFVHSNIITITGTANGALNTTSLPFQANTMSGNVTTANTQITAIAPSTFIAEKNAFTQNPVVRLYSIYYPGEWYPPNANGNPTGDGAGYGWPSIFPIRLAEIVGDVAQDISYNVSYGGSSYSPYPINLTGLDQGSDGRISELSLSVFNTDNIISYLVENPYLVGINTDNSVYATVNGELVYGIDPRTVPSTVTYSNALATAAIINARNKGLAYDAAIEGYYGKANAMFDKTMTEDVGGTWEQKKMDTRDLLGAAVEIKTTFANFLDYWPEYSLVSSAVGNTIYMRNTLPYRVGDLLQTPSNAYTTANVLAITSDDGLILDRPIVRYLPITRDTSTQSMYFKPDGTKVYFLGSTNDRVYEYNLSTPWDIPSATYLQNVSVTTQETAPTALTFSSNGTFMYVAGTARDNIYRYTLSTAWNVTTASLTQTFNIASREGNVSGITFDSTGANLYVIGTSSDRVTQFNLAVAYSLATATYRQNVIISTQETTSSDLYFRGDGYRFYIIGSSSDSIHQYDLSTPWNVTTATYTGNTFLGTLEPSPTMIYFDEFGEKVYFGAASNAYQVALTDPWDITTIDYAPPVGTALYINNPQADSSSYLTDSYKIDQLESLGENVATFGLVSWLQYFKIVTPKRKYYKNTCQWVYRGEECQYPGPNGGPIPGALFKSANVSPIALDNSVAASLSGDKCAKSIAACTLRNNEIHFGGFPGVGRTVPQM